MFFLAPSILSADFSKLGEEVLLVEQSGLQMLHIDVMDGRFVPSISIGLPVIESIRDKSHLIFDVHLMIEEPERYIHDFAAAGADIITIHAEACRHLHRTIFQIKEEGKKCCVALNPATPLNVLDYLYDDLDMVLIMTVNPGFGGQDYIPAMTEKIHQMRMNFEQRELSTDIEVDGGIRKDNVQNVLHAGANVIVAGSSVFDAGKTEKNIREYKNLFASFEAEEKNGK